MRAYACDVCRSLVLFDNSVCVTCRSQLGFDRPRSQLIVLVDRDGARGPRAGELVRCANADLANCNWLVGPEAPGGLCDSCALTRTRPADGDTAGLAAFALTEAAKRQLVAQLDVLGLPIITRTEDPDNGLTFDLLSSEYEPVTTGHADGVITVDLAEGDDPHREALRVQLAEPYRTLLGHLRHEVGHWYWSVLVDGTEFLPEFRERFGDEREDYAAALKSHYGPDSAAEAADAEHGDWAADYVSHYAAAHPWEDWAESFAHYLHIRDSLDTAQNWRMHVDGPDLDLSLAWNAELAVDPVADVESFDELARMWIALAMTLNAMTRSMGKEDLYPFRLTPTVLEKLRFVHVVVTSYRPA